MEYAFADNGTLIYIPGAATDAAGRTLGFGDGSGRAEALAVPPGTYDEPRVSPDGRRIAYTVSYPDGTDIAVYEIGSNAAPRRLTFGGVNSMPAWSADSMRVAYWSTREDAPGIYWNLADGTDVEERLTMAADGERQVPDSFSPDGQYLAYTVTGESSAVWRLTLETLATESLIESPDLGASHAAFSPDGNWLAYQAYDTGDNEIYVVPFPLTGSRYQLPSRGDNHHPAWSADGSQLYYIPGQNRFERVDVATERGVSFGNPVVLDQSPLNLSAPDVSRRYDVMPDGSGILGWYLGGSESARDEQRIIVVENWFEDLKRLVPVD
jgi:serine/threonine-protein kinase